MVRPATASNFWEVALRMSDASPVYYRHGGDIVEVIDPETGETQTAPVMTFQARYCTLYQQMPDHLRAKARAAPNYREWQAQRGQTGGANG